MFGRLAQTVPPLAAWSLTTLTVALAACLLVGGCMVDSTCHSNYDCSSDETCNLATGQCFVQCTTDQHCHVKGAYVGKDCIENRCQFTFDERMPAPNFCLNVVNPKSAHYPKKLCLQQLQGKVVFIFFGLMA